MSINRRLEGKRVTYVDDIETKGLTVTTIPKSGNPRGSQTTTVPGFDGLLKQIKHDSTSHRGPRAVVIGASIVEGLGERRFLLLARDLHTASGGEVYVRNPETRRLRGIGIRELDLSNDEKDRYAFWKTRHGIKAKKR